jgi:hypothetical protein
MGEIDPVILRFNVAGCAASAASEAIIWTGGLRTYFKHFKPLLLLLLLRNHYLDRQAPDAYWKL